MIYVDKHGNRVTNEKLAYNESAQAFFEWNPALGEYSNLVLVAIWDQRSQDHSASSEYGRFIVPPGTNDDHVIKAASVEELTRRIAERLAKYARHTGDLKLTPDFAANLSATVKRFNEFARSGKDLDFHRGERPVELLFNGPAAAAPAAPNPTMYPIAEAGPFYAALMTGGNLDTKGGPKTTPDGKVLDVSRPADRRPLRRGQLRRFGFRARLLGRRRDARADPRFLLSRRQGGACRAGETDRRLTRGGGIGMPRTRRGVIAPRGLALNRSFSTGGTIHGVNQADDDERTA